MPEHFDFVGLSRAARELPGPDTHDRLWSAWFALQVWHFIKAPSPSGWLPYSLAINGERCVLAFTDGVKADGYARFANLPIDPRVPSPVLSLHPEAMLQLVPQMRMWNVTGFVVDVGRDQFFTRLDQLFAMYGRYHHTTAPQPPRPPPPPPAPPQPQRRELTVDAMLALPVWHVVTARDNPSFPDFAFSGSELVAQIYSRPRDGAMAMPPREVLSLLTDIELVGLVRFDDVLEVGFVDLKLRSHQP